LATELFEYANNIYNFYSPCKYGRQNTNISTVTTKHKIYLQHVPINEQFATILS